MHVAAGAELHQELEHHTVHVGGREHGHAVGGIVQMAVHLEAEKDVRKQGTVRQHDSFGESGSSGGIVDHGQLLGGVLVVIYTVGMEAAGIFLAEKLIEVLSGMGYLVIGGIEQGKIVHQDNGVQARHLRLGEAFPHHIPDEEHTGVGMVDEVVDVPALELMQQRHGHGSVGQGREEGNGPVGLVPRADGYLVAALQSAHLEHDMYLLNPAGHVPVVEGHSVVVGERGAVPVLLDACFDDLVQ